MHTVFLESLLSLCIWSSTLRNSSSFKTHFRLLVLNVAQLDCQQLLWLACATCRATVFSVLTSDKTSCSADPDHLKSLFLRCSSKTAGTQILFDNWIRFCSLSLESSQECLCDFLIQDYRTQLRTLHLRSSCSLTFLDGFHRSFSLSCVLFKAF